MIRFVRILAHIGIFIGLLRLVEYHFFGDLHRGYALAWAIHALVSGVLILLLTAKEAEQQKLARKKVIWGNSEI